MPERRLRIDIANDPRLMAAYTALDKALVMASINYDLTPIEGAGLVGELLAMRLGAHIEAKRGDEDPRHTEAASAIVAAAMERVAVLADGPPTPREIGPRGDLVAGLDIVIVNAMQIVSGFKEARAEVKANDPIAAADSVGVALEAMLAMQGNLETLQPIATQYAQSAAHG